MRWNLNAGDWRVLRLAMRVNDDNGRQGCDGRSLRIDMSRKTKDGSFLTRLVDRGLLQIVKKAPDDGTPFDATYAVTPGGEKAAEYGWYESSTFDGVISPDKRK